MAATKNRRTTPKGIMERVTGKKLESNVLPAAHKVLIMEYLLSCPMKEIQNPMEEIRNRTMTILRLRTHLLSAISARVRTNATTTKKK